MTEPIGFLVLGLAWDSSIDRFDVAIRAVWFCFRNGLWAILDDLGLERIRTERLLEEAQDTIEGIRSDHQIAVLLRLCPFIYGAALELLRRYQIMTAASRREFKKFERKVA